jgi:hypothetical protein
VKSEEESEGNHGGFCVSSCKSLIFFFFVFLHPSHSVLPIGLVKQPDALEHIGNIVESSLLRHAQHYSRTLTHGERKRDGGRRIRKNNVPSSATS